MAEISVTNSAINSGALAVAGDVTAWGANSDLTLFLVANDFTPDPALVFADLTFLTGDGLTGHDGVATTPTMVWNSEMGVWGISVPFTGGSTFTYTGAGDPDVQAFGWAIVNTDTEVLIASGSFDDPIVFDHTGVTAHVPETNAWFAAPFIGNLPVPSV